MPYIFAYGTLQQPREQRQAFGRVLRAVPDSLPGFALDSVVISDPAIAGAFGIERFANVIASASTDVAVPGLALEVTPSELDRADIYEAAYQYRRIEVVLTSGREAWVYRFDGH